MKSEVLDRFLAILFLRNSDQGRFGDLLVEYRKAYAGQENKYPKNISTMIDIMRAQPKKRSRKKNPKSFEVR